MSVINSLRRSFAPIHPEGYVFVAGFAVATLDPVVDLGVRSAGSA